MAQKLPAKAEVLGIIQKVNDTWQGRHPGEGNLRTAFFTYGLFWGIKQGLLDAKTYLPAALQGGY